MILAKAVDPYQARDGEAVASTWSPSVTRRAVEEEDPSYFVALASTRSPSVTAKSGNPTYPSKSSRFQGVSRATMGLAGTPRSYHAHDFRPGNTPRIPQ